MTALRSRARRALDRFRARLAVARIANCQQCGRLLDGEARVADSRFCSLACDEQYDSDRAW